MLTFASCPSGQTSNDCSCSCHQSRCQTPVVSLLHRYPRAHQCCTCSASQRTSIDQQSRRSSEHRLSGESVSTAAHRLGCRSGEGAASEGQPSAERRSFDRGSRGSFEGRPPLSPQVPPQTLQGFSPFANAPAFGPTSQTPIGYVPVLTLSLSSNYHHAGSAAAELAPVVLCFTWMTAAPMSATPCLP